MSKRSNSGKAYFYAMGQRDAIKDEGVLFSNFFRERKPKLNFWAFKAWLNGYNGH